MNDFASQFVKDRDEAFTNAVMKNDWKGLKAFCKKYNMNTDVKPEIMKAGIYKAVQECTNIPLEVKRVAYKKCVKLGFSPFMKPYEDWSDEDE